MQVTLNDKTFIFPSSLAEFTLGQRIAFQEQHGNELDAMLKSILEMEDGLDKELEITEFQFEKCFRTFSFFSGVDVQVLKESEYVDDIAAIYYANCQVLFEEESKIELSQTYEWNGDIWQLHPPELKNGSKLMFGEFVDSKQIVKYEIELGKGKWEYLLPLAAIYLRKEGEKYQESFLYEGSERLKLMESLPLSIALAVGFFLNSYLNIVINTLQSSSPEKLRLAGLQNNILTALAG